LVLAVLAGADEVSAADVAAAVGWRRKLAESVLAELSSSGKIAARDEEGLRLWSM